MARVLDVQQAAAGTQRFVGTVGELWRYPVKSMLGSRIPEAGVTERGCLGDRAWALRDLASGRIASAKRFPQLLSFRATYEVEPTPASGGRARIDTPDGRSISTDDPAASAIISEIPGDQKPGDTNGEGVNAFGGLWYALSSAGDQIVGSAPNSGIGY